MIVAHHLLWTIYGYWLPNDPRGSRSRAIHSDALAELGEIHFERKRVQPRGKELQEFRERAAKILKYEIRELSDGETARVGEAIQEVMRARSYTCYACAIMPDHVHLLIRKHRDNSDVMIAEFQRASRNSVVECGERPAEHSVWGGAGWRVYLETKEDIERIARYIEANPIKARLPEQTWPFVTEYDGWLPGLAATRRPAKSQARREPKS
jgi:REP element-mobilizing transposase RayT